MTSDDIIKIPTKAIGDKGQSMYTCFTRESFKGYLNDQIINKNMTFDAIVNPTNRETMTGKYIRQVLNADEYARLLRKEQENSNPRTDEDEFEEEDETIDNLIGEIVAELEQVNTNENNNMTRIDDKIWQILEKLNDENPREEIFIQKYEEIMNILRAQIDNIIQDSVKKEQLYDILNKYNVQLGEPIFGTVSIAEGDQRGGKKQFLYNPNDPKRSFDVYIDKDPSDTISIKYATISDVKNTIKKLEKLYKEGKYSHKRIWQVGMIMKVRLEAMKKHKKKLYPNAKNVTERYNLANKYFKFLSKRTKMNEKERKKSRFVI
jgi:hypothetical protein